MPPKLSPHDGVACVVCREIDGDTINAPCFSPFWGFVWLSALEEIGRQASRQRRDWIV